jgi:hypothetical protein
MIWKLRLKEMSFLTSVKTRMAGRFALVRIFALVGFCNAVLMICLFLYMEWRNLKGGPVLFELMRILFPGLVMDLEPATKFDYVGVFLQSIVMNAFIYAIFGYVVVFTFEAWRRYFPSKKT